jgi:hypothetical protein
MICFRYVSLKTLHKADDDDDDDDDNPNYIMIARLMVRWNLGHGYSRT